MIYELIRNLALALCAMLSCSLMFLPANAQRSKRRLPILDYSRRRIIFEPNAHLAEPYEEDMSGLALVPIGKGGEKLFKVQQVLANTPAAEAGLCAGDVITTIDGTPANAFTLNQLNKLFMQDGREVSLSFRRGRKPIETKIKLRRLI